MSRERIAQIAFFAVLGILAAVVAVSWLRREQSPSGEVVRMQAESNRVVVMDKARRPVTKDVEGSETLPGKILVESGGPNSTALVTLVIKAIVSVVALVFSFVLVLQRSSSEETRKWATGIIGVVIGFWLGSTG
jgi:hypothetical protein